MSIKEDAAKDIAVMAGKAVKDVTIGVLKITFGTLKYLSQAVLDVCSGTEENHTDKK